MLLDIICEIIEVTGININLYMIKPMFYVLSFVYNSFCNILCY